MVKLYSHCLVLFIGFLMWVQELCYQGFHNLSAFLKYDISVSEHYDSLINKMNQIQKFNLH